MLFVMDSSLPEEVLAVHDRHRRPVVEIVDFSSGEDLLPELAIAEHDHSWNRNGRLLEFRLGDDGFEQIMNCGGSRVS